MNNAENIQNSSTICAEFGEVFDLEGEHIETFSGGVFPQIIIKTNDGKYMTINKYVPPLSKSYVIAKIFMKYFDELKLSRDKLKNQSISIQHGSTRGYNYPNDVGVRNPIDSYWWSFLEHKMIIVQLPNNHVGDLPTFINNAKSLLYHEYLHLDGYNSEEDKTKKGIIKHLELYEKQLKHPEFGLCTTKFKNWIRGNFSDYVEKLGPNGEFKDLALYADWKIRLKKQGL